MQRNIFKQIFTQAYTQMYTQIFQRLLIIFTAILLTGFASPVAVPASQVHRIYNISEIHTPAPQHHIIHIRTDLGVNYVWTYYNHTPMYGWVYSYGSHMKVWQISFISLSTSLSLDIKASSCPTGGIAYSQQHFQLGDIIPPLTHTPISTAPLPTASPHTQPQNQTATWRNIIIIGDTHFIQRTQSALAIIETGPLWAYTYVTTYLNYIIQDLHPSPYTRAGGRVYLQTRRFYVYTQTYRSHWLGWYASAILHEAVHVRQFRQHREIAPRAPFAPDHPTRVAMELEAVEFQLKFLEEKGLTDTAKMARRIIRDLRNGWFWW